MNDVNLALNRPARQSSTSKWSTDPHPEIDARVANNGDLSARYFHTKEERQPWWQVDLEGVYILTRVALFNRMDAQRRLRSFSLLRSVNGTDWFPLYRKTDDADFRDLLIDVEVEGLARFVRVRLNNHGILHFRECQVFGRRPDPTESERLLAEDARRLRDSAKLPEGRSGRLREIGGFRVFVDDQYGANVKRSLELGGYEGKERDAVLKFVQNTDKVLEIGTAVGVVAMTIASIVGAENVLTFDANPYVVEDARANFARNGMAEIRSRVGVLVNRNAWAGDGSTADFHVAKDFWASRLHAARGASDIEEVVEVSTLCLEQEIADHQANVIVCDIEGGEVELFADADLSRIRLIIMETHYGIVGEVPTDRMVSQLIARGFSLHLGASVGHVVVLRRH